MSTATKLSKVDRPERFMTKPGSAYYYRGKTIDLTVIDTATAEALANDPGCMFIQWADPKLRPQHQRSPFPPVEQKEPMPAKKG